MKNNTYSLGVLYALLGAICWGFSGASGQYLFEFKHINPQWLVSIRLLISGIFLFVVLYIYKKNKIFDIFKSKKSLFMLFIFATFGLTLCQFTYYLTIKLTNAAIATVLQYTAPAFIILFVSLKEKKLPKKTEIFALFLAMLGVFLLATHGDFELNIPLNALLIGILSALCIVIYSTTPISLNKTYGTATTLCFGLLIGGIFSSFFTQNLFDFSAIDDFEAKLALAGVILFGTFLAFSFYLFGVNIIGPTRASLVASIEPISAAFFSYIWLGTTFVFMDFIGFFMILICTILLSKK